MARDAWIMQPEITRVMRENMPARDLYSTFFRHRGMSERFTFPEKKLLKDIVDVAWRNRPMMNRDAESVLTVTTSVNQLTDVFGRTIVNPWLGEVEGIGQFYNEETWATVLENGAEGSQKGDFYYWANIHGLRSKDLARKRASELKATRDVRADLVATNIDYQRGERPVSIGDGTREMTVFGQLVQDLRTEFGSLLTLSTHGPGTAFKCMEYDMPILDLSPLPLLLEAADKLGFLGNDLVVISGDEGALEAGVMIKDLIEEKKGLKIQIVPGFKKKEGNKATVVFLARDLENVKGKTAVIGEDIIDSGKTILAIIDQLLNAGAKKVVVLATHAVMSTPDSGGAERLGNLENVEIIITDSIRAELPEKVEVTQATNKNIHFIDVIEPMKMVVEADKAGRLKDIYSNDKTRQMLLKMTGLDIAPWLISAYVDEAEALTAERISEIQEIRSYGGSVTITS